LKKIIYEQRGDIFTVRKVVNGVEVDNAAFVITGGMSGTLLNRVTQQARDAGWEVEIKWDSKAA
jgi:hypothetical protein